jgi:hypothetical protein
MRLPIIEHGHTFVRKLMLFVVRLLMRSRPPDVVKTLFYRPEFLGDHLSAWTNQILRGPSEWTVGERELFAAFTSKLNQCEF